MDFSSALAMMQGGQAAPQGAGFGLGQPLVQQGPNGAQMAGGAAPGGMGQLDPQRLQQMLAMAQGMMGQQGQQQGGMGQMMMQAPMMGAMGGGGQTAAQRGYLAAGSLGRRM